MTTAAVCTSPAAMAANARRPRNVIVILCDDLGYGDLSITGARGIKTPNIDRMAREGRTFSQFYAAANLCTPSRAGLLTGRYPVRTGLGDKVILYNDDRVLPTSEVTIPTALKTAGYATGLFGKWHLGHRGPDWLPTHHGFDRFVGIPYSHDMSPLVLVRAEAGKEAHQVSTEITPLQQIFCEEAEQFITENAERPFFVELALSAPHLPCRPPAPFAGRSGAGAYGDSVEEVDDKVGRILALLRKLGIERDTLVLFTSDNGPWYEGSSGPLRQRKGGGGYDGASKVPMIAWSPGSVSASSHCDAIAMAIDFLPTCCALAGVPLPEVELDGKDISSLIFDGAEQSPHEELVLFDNEDPVAIRTQHWKFVSGDYFLAAFRPTDPKYPQLYDLRDDPAENYSKADRHPEVLADMRHRLERARERFAPFKRASQPRSSGAHA
ncbi:sulfatase [Novosphingobium sp. PY1]|uniref:sulfatase family protein n=1 Tax=Novosphingobium sp. PY1 TaxID=1882221 RepID=UPI001F5C2F93|nr:sulfatase [Novosphingobium sp. PY1]